MRGRSKKSREICFHVLDLSVVRGKIVFKLLAAFDYCFWSMWGKRNVSLTRKRLLLRFKAQIIFFTFNVNTCISFSLTMLPSTDILTSPFSLSIDFLSLSQSRLPSWKCVCLYDQQAFSPLHIIDRRKKSNGTISAIIIFDIDSFNHINIAPLYFDFSYTSFSSFPHVLFSSQR